jgi:hypothetical protein
MLSPLELLDDSDDFYVETAGNNSSVLDFLLCHLAEVAEGRS